MEREMRRERATKLSRPTGARARAWRGLSLVEATIAAALLLLITVGVLPLFARSLSNNLAGAESSSASNTARSRAEELFQLPFNHGELTLASGTERVTEAYFSLRDQRWKPGPEPPDGSDPAIWRRITTIRQYGVAALDDDLLASGEALESGADPGRVHLKEIEVAVLATRTAGPLGPGRRIAVRLLKSH